MQYSKLKVAFDIYNESEISQWATPAMMITQKPSNI